MGKNENKFSRYGLGAIPSPPDSRDYQFGDLMMAPTDLPTEWRANVEAPILDQGSTSTCAACTGATCRFIQEKIENDEYSDPFSVSYIYSSREASGYTGEGMYSRDLMRALKNKGDCKYKTLPGFPDSYFSSVKQVSSNKTKCDKEAIPYRIKSYYSVRGETQMKVALMATGCLAGMFMIYECFYTPKDGKVEYSIEKRGREYGGHAMTIVGWTEYGWLLQNSWGKDWGSNGLVEIPYSYPIAECWAMVDDETRTHLESGHIVNVNNVKKEGFLTKVKKFIIKLFKKA